MESNIKVSNVDTQIFQMAITYVSAHEDVKNMSPDEFCEKVLDANREFSNLWGKYRLK